MKLIYVVVSCAVLCMATVPLQAQGVMLVQKETRGGISATNQIQIDKSHMRSESSADQTAVTFDGPSQTMRMLNIGNKTYQEISRADLEQIKQQLDGVMAQLQGLPPAQRQMMEQVMQGRGMPGIAAAAAPKPEYRPAGSDKVGNWVCTKYEGFVNLQKTVEVCAVDPKTFNLSPADFDISRQLADFMRVIVPGGADRMIMNGSVQDQGYAGIAVRRTTFRNGAIEVVSEITDLRRETFPAATFEVPSGFKKEANPGLRGGR
jgi:hypothetical protein